MDVELNDEQDTCPSFLDTGEDEQGAININRNYESLDNLHVRADLITGTGSDYVYQVTFYSREEKNQQMKRHSRKRTHSQCAYLNGIVGNYFSAHLLPHFPQLG